MKRNSFVITVALLTLLATASAVQAAPPSSAFSGSWVGTDPVDDSTEYLVVKGGSSTRISYQDDFGQVCWDARSTDFWFSSTLKGTVNGSTMSGVFIRAGCGHVSLSWMKGQTMSWSFDPHGAGAADDTLFDGVVTWRRV